MSFECLKFWSSWISLDWRTSLLCEKNLVETNFLPWVRFYPNFFSPSSNPASLLSHANAKIKIDLSTSLAHEKLLQSWKNHLEILQLSKYLCTSRDGQNFRIKRQPKKRNSHWINKNNLNWTWCGFHQPHFRGKRRKIKIYFIIFPDIPIKD